MKDLWHKQLVSARQLRKKKKPEKQYFMPYAIWLALLVLIKPL